MNPGANRGYCIINCRWLCMILWINGLFAQSLRYAQKIILGISTIYLRLFFSHALILNENPHKSTESCIDYLQSQ